MARLTLRRYSDADAALQRHLATGLRLAASGRSRDAMTTTASLCTSLPSRPAAGRSGGPEGRRYPYRSRRSSPQREGATGRPMRHHPFG